MSGARDRALHRRGAGGRLLPKLEDLPIPEGVQPGPGWTEQMREMADHIGPYATLRLVAAFGGQEVYVPFAAQLSPFTGLLGADTARHFAHIYGGNKLRIPVGRVAVARARRAVIIAAVQAKEMSIADAACVLSTSRSYMSYLVNHAREASTASTGNNASNGMQGDLFSTR